MIKQQKKFKLLLITIGAALATLAHSLEFPLPPPGNDLVGKLQTVTAHKGDSLSSIGMHYDIGYYEMVEVNPELPSTGTIPAGTSVTIPSQFLLPSIRKGLVVNLAELRVYFFPTTEQKVYTFPIGAGREGWNTPIASTSVANKKQDPTWTPPPSIIAESRRLGKPIKASYPPGPNNPLGKYAIYLQLPGIRIHGTNVQASVGRRVSHGCIRMLADDIKFLYENLPIGTPVEITHEENKVGWAGPILYLESEVPFNEYMDVDSAQTAIAKATKNHPAIIDQQRVKDVLDNRDGVPVAIGHDKTVSSLPIND